MLCFIMFVLLIIIFIVVGLAFLFEAGPTMTKLWIYCDEELQKEMQLQINDLKESKLDASELLRLRYAVGEISREEFLERKKYIEGKAR